MCRSRPAWGDRGADIGELVGVPRFDGVGGFALVGDGSGVLGEAFGGHRLAGFGGSGEYRLGGGSGGRALVAELV